MILSRQEAVASLTPYDWVRGAIEASGDLVYEWDLVGNSILWAGHPTGIFGAVAIAALSTSDRFNKRIHPEDLPVRLKALSDHLSEGAPYDCEYRVRTGSGSYSWVNDRGQARFSAAGTPERLIGSLRLITARKQNEVRLERLANFDELTGHLNKIRLRDALEHALASCHRFNLTGGLLVVGLDKLAMINNAFGYQAGDAALIAVGQRLDRCLRTTDIVGRIDADRFGIVIGQSSADQLARAAERILQAMREQPIETPDGKIDVTVSIGGILVPQSSSTSYDAIAKAETALKEAKVAGRDCFVLYQTSDHQDRLHRRSLDIGAQVQQAIRDDRLLFAFQPVVKGCNRQAAFYECLLRMRGEGDEPGKDLIPASAFVPVMEQLGLVRRMDRHVLDLAVRELHESRDVTLAINISGITATDQAWLRALIALLKGKPEIASRLIVEITETTALHDIDESARFVTAVRDLGCRVAVDDFGAGFTSFRHLKALAVDIVKLDGSFVRNLAENVNNQLFIRNMLGVADAFNLETVAECVETESEVAFLLGEGVQYLQGYYFGRPDTQRPWLKKSQRVVGVA
ncbi:bifunctional diguanylate cyclase/phosphodiesterase [Rhodospirillaceae bacterium SYSU D60014]|uniref:putative bifunctional diguanylate cyclase/phosphodiesterase n=1 Tax=Virgifigura deserti TaxID=2268457 RepID=UPI000E669C6D